jgi:(S)-ureidoglycine aminohydrolase
MSQNPFGHTRDVVTSHYTLQTPGGFVPSQLPGWTNVTIHLNISPAVGAKFAQYQFTYTTAGLGTGATGDLEWAVYVLDGALSLTLNAEKHELKAGSFVYIPPKSAYTFSATAPAKMLVFEKRYEPLSNVAVPGALVGHASTVEGQPFLGDPDARLQVLFPDHLGFDLAMNIFVYQPGATLPFVETHIMEHGLLMLKGQGVYRLGGDYHLVQEGDVIWMAPYCPQWFVAMGKTPASYLYYKNVNRAPAL